MRITRCRQSIQEPWFEFLSSSTLGSWSSLEMDLRIVTCSHPSCHFSSTTQTHELGSGRRFKPNGLR